MDKDFIGKRISELCLDKKVSEREVSLSLSKNASYINYITNGKMLPTIESLFDICEYFKITPSEFFESDVDNLYYLKDLYKEGLRISNNDIESLLSILKIIEPKDFSSFLTILNKYKHML